MVEVQESGQVASEVDEAVFRGLPASAQRILRAIIDHGPVSHPDLQQMTRIPPRTIRFAIRRLRDEQLIIGRLNLRDCRTCFFMVHPRLVKKDEDEPYTAAPLEDEQRPLATPIGYAWRD